MKIEGWEYYNHAVIPVCAPHEQPNLNPIKDRTIWKCDGKPIFARWTTDFDCKEETSWWFCIKDTSFNIADIKAKRRYEINKGNRNFTVKEINPKEYKEELFEIDKAAYSGWPEWYRPVISKESFFRKIFWF